MKKTTTISLGLVVDFWSKVVMDAVWYLWLFLIACTSNECIVWLCFYFSFCNLLHYMKYFVLWFCKKGAKSGWVTVFRKDNRTAEITGNQQHKRRFTTQQGSFFHHIQCETTTPTSTSTTSERLILVWD